MNNGNDKNTDLKSIYEDVMLPNYAPADFIPDRAQGSRVWDKNNKEYIDLGGGIAVNSLGHSNPILIKRLMTKLISFGTQVIIFRTNLR